MADRKDIEFSYSLTDRVVRLSLGELADFSGAKYDGDFNLTLEEAQRRKHEYVAEQIGIGPGDAFPTSAVAGVGCSTTPAEPLRREGWQQQFRWRWGRCGLSHHPRWSGKPRPKCS